MPTYTTQTRPPIRRGVPQDAPTAQPLPTGGYPNASQSPKWFNLGVGSVNDNPQLWARTFQSAGMGVANAPGAPGAPQSGWWNAPRLQPFTPPAAGGGGGTYQLPNYATPKMPRAQTFQGGGAQYGRPYGQGMPPMYGAMPPAGEGGREYPRPPIQTPFGSASAGGQYPIPSVRAPSASGMTPAGGGQFAMPQNLQQFYNVALQALDRYAPRTSQEAQQYGFSGRPGGLSFGDMLTQLQHLPQQGYEWLSQNSPIPMGNLQRLIYPSPNNPYFERDFGVPETNRMDIWNWNPLLSPLGAAGGGQPAMPPPNVPSAPMPMAAGPGTNRPQMSVGEQMTQGYQGYQGQVGKGMYAPSDVAMEGTAPVSYQSQGVGVGASNPFINPTPEIPGMTPAPGLPSGGSRMPGGAGQEWLGIPSVEYVPGATPFIGNYGERTSALDYLPGALSSPIDERTSALDYLPGGTMGGGAYSTDDTGFVPAPDQYGNVSLFGESEPLPYTSGNLGANQQGGGMSGYGMGGEWGGTAGGYTPIPPIFSIGGYNANPLADPLGFNFRNIGRTNDVIQSIFENLPPTRVESGASGLPAGSGGGVSRDGAIDNATRQVILSLLEQIRSGGIGNLSEKVTPDVISTSDPAMQPLKEALAKLVAGELGQQGGQSGSIPPYQVAPVSPYSQLVVDKRIEDLTQPSPLRKAAWDAAFLTPLGATPYEELGGQYLNETLGGGVVSPQSQARIDAATAAVNEQFDRASQALRHELGSRLFSGGGAQQLYDVERGRAQAMLGERANILNQQEALRAGLVGSALGLGGTLAGRPMNVAQQFASLDTNAFQLADRLMDAIDQFGQLDQRTMQSIYDARVRTAIEQYQRGLISRQQARDLIYSGTQLNTPRYEPGDILQTLSFLPMLQGGMTGLGIR